MYTLLIVALPMSGACQRPNERHDQRTLRPEAPAKWTEDSARYLADSTKWVRDSIVRDSILRTINTDTLFRDYHRMLAAADPVALVGQVECECSNVLWHYGGLPGIAAIDRMMDTVWRRDDTTAVRRMYDKTTDESLPTLQERAKYQCVMNGRRHPSILNGTDLDAMGGRPPRPVHP